MQWAAFSTTPVGPFFSQQRLQSWSLTAISAFCADLAEKLDAEQDQPVNLGPGTDDFRARLRYEPMGVAACIIPWNYPLLMACWKVKC